MTAGRAERGTRWRAAVGLLVLLLIGASGGCGTTIIPPPQLYDPVTVYVVDKGRTPSLVVPDHAGTLIRYTYGEWRWYALNETGPLRGLAALLWPTQGALGRAVLEGEPTLGTVQRHLPGALEILPVRVEQALVGAFAERMAQQYEQARHTEVYAPHVRLHFVHHPRRYTWFRNSNHAVASWLREIGCETRGLSYRSRWSSGG
jgi:hypothetical protein